MSKSIIRGALVAVTLAAGLSGFGAAPASADTVRVVLRDGVRAEPVQYRRDDHWNRREGYRDGSCRARTALRKAYDMGADRPRVVRETPRAVVVDGLRRGRPITVRFANEAGCPVLAVRR